MSFEFIDGANLKLKELANKDKKYKVITDRIGILLSRIQGEFLAFDETHQKVTKETKSSHEITKKRYHQKIAALGTDFETYKVNIGHQIASLNESTDQKTIILDEKTNLVIEKLNQELIDIEAKMTELKAKALATKSKDLSYIEKVVSDIKKQSTKSIHQIETNFASDLEKVNKKYQKSELKILDDMKHFETQTLLEKEKIQQAKNTYREQSDAKYLTVKHDYHQASAAFNKKVDQLKKKKDEAVTKLKTAYQNALIPVEQELKKIESDFSVLKVEQEKIYNEKALAHKKEIVEIIKNYNTKKNQIIKETSDAITLYNSKLSAFRETLIKDRSEQQKEYKEDMSILTSEDDKKQLIKEKNRVTSAQDNELSKQIIRTNRETLVKTKDQYMRLSQAETEFLQNRSNWRINGKILLINAKLQNFHNEQNYQYQCKAIDTKLKKLKLTLEHELEILDLKHLEQIAPLDADLSIANAVSERDVNLLSNDTNYHLNHYQHQEDVLDYELQLYILNQNEKLDNEKLRLEYERSVLSMTEQLSIEKETVIREQQLKNQDLKKDLVRYTFDAANLTYELDYLLVKSDLTTQIDYALKEQQLMRDYYHLDTSLSINAYRTGLQFEDEKLHFQDHLEQINTEVEMLTKDLNVVHSRIHYLFNQIYIVYNIHHHFMLEMINLYQLPAHPEDVKYFISLYLEVFKSLSAIQESVKDAFLVDMKTYHEIKINDLTGYRYQTNLKVIETDYDIKTAELDDVVQHIQKKVGKINDQILVLDSNIDRLQSKINQIESKMDIESNKKQKKQYQSDIDNLVRQINSIESEMNILSKEIQKFDRPLNKIETQKKALLLNFEEKKKILHSQQQIDAKIFFQQLSFYKQLMKRLTNLFTAYETKIQPLTHKLNQPIYLTDDIIKEYERNFYKLEESFEKQSHVLYQALLKGSMKLFDDLNHDQNSLKSNFMKEQAVKQSNHEKNELDFTVNKEQLLLKNNQQRENLSKEKISVILSLKATHQKDKHNALNDLKERIKLVENQIMTAEEKLKNELLLIDANLKSVVSQLETEYQRNISRTHDGYQKNTQKASDVIDAKQKNLKTLEESTQLKNSLLLSRYNQTENRMKDNLKEKLANYQESNEKKIANYQKRLLQIDLELKNAYDRQVQLLNTHKKKSQISASKVENYEQRIYQKDLQDAKKSYAFKQKTLKL